MGNNKFSELDHTKVNFREPRRFIGVTYRNLFEDLLIGAEMTQKQLHHKRPPNVCHKPWYMGI